MALGKPREVNIVEVVMEGGLSSQVTSDEGRLAASFSEREVPRHCQVNNNQLWATRGELQLRAYD